MKQYYCPYCRAHLNVHGYIVLTLKRKEGRSGIILMSDTIGDYTTHINTEINLGDGEKAHFYCPCCAKSLEYEQNKNMVKIFKVDELGEEHTVIFSAIFGEKSTYKLSLERQLSFGEHAMKFIDPEWYLKR
ncbi:MAG: hypothetical protein JKY54_16135 [Flavobacteriales bacterium]|nr:hypothetical protein [Flavobacteriales bacterium]